MPQEEKEEEVTATLQAEEIFLEITNMEYHIADQPMVKYMPNVSITMKRKTEIR